MPIDYKKYPPNWLTEIRPRILKREENKCKFCKVENYALILRGNWDGKEAYQDMDGYIFDSSNGEKIGENVFPVWSTSPKNRIVKVVLTIAHLDHDAENWDVSDDRLAALCQKCHNNYDKEHRAKTRRSTKYKNTLFPL